MTPRETEERLTALWEAVDTLLARATLPGVLAHQLGPLAASRLRRDGRALPRALAVEERAAALCHLSARPLLERIRDACAGPLILVKGPEVGRLYRDHARTFGDVDILTSDVQGVQRSLLAHGFEEQFDPEVIAFGVEHHQMPLKWPTIGLKIEVHRSPNWPLALPPPSFEEILDAAVPSSLGVDGIHAPALHHHAVMLAAHGWTHEPLWRLRDLVDAAVMSVHADRDALQTTAKLWGVERIWRTTDQAADSVFFGHRDTIPLRTWARHLEPVRERRGWEKHLHRLVSGYWALPPGAASVQALRAMSNLIAPTPGETWRAKAARVPKALRNLRAPVAREHGRARAAKRRDDGDA